MAEALSPTMFPESSGVQVKRSFLEAASQLTGMISGGAASTPEGMKLQNALLKTLANPRPFLRQLGELGLSNRFIESTRRLITNRSVFVKEVEEDAKSLTSEVQAMVEEEILPPSAQDIMRVAEPLLLDLDPEDTQLDPATGEYVPVQRRLGDESEGGPARSPDQEPEEEGGDNGDDQDDQPQRHTSHLRRERRGRDKRKETGFLYGTRSCMTRLAITAAIVAALCIYLGISKDPVSRTIRKYTSDPIVSTARSGAEEILRQIGGIISGKPSILIKPDKILSRQSPFESQVEGPTKTRVTTMLESWKHVGEEDTFVYPVSSVVGTFLTGRRSVKDKYPDDPVAGYLKEHENGLVYDAVENGLTIQQRETVAALGDYFPNEETVRDETRRVAIAQGIEDGSPQLTDLMDSMAALWDLGENRTPLSQEQLQTMFNICSPASYEEGMTRYGPRLVGVIDVETGQLSRAEELKRQKGQSLRERTRTQAYAKRAAQRRPTRQSRRPV